MFYGDGALAVVMAINVMIGLAYYLRFLAVVVAPVPDDARTPVVSIGTGETWVRSALGLTLAALVVTSLWPDLVMRLLVT